MKKILFAKMAASGNDFVVIEQPPQSIVLNTLARKMCNRKYGIGADGLLVLQKSPKADIRMRVFNPDGSEAQMCGNGARCAAFYINAKRGKAKNTILTKAGIIESEVNHKSVRIHLTEPRDLRLDFALKVNGRSLKVNFLNTGVPHAVVLVDCLDCMDVVNLGRRLRYHKAFSPAGTNVDFIEAAGADTIRIRTYERGVEDETLACGTGSVAGALIFAIKSGIRDRVRVITKCGETLDVYFIRTGTKFSNVWLEGTACIVYKGAYNV